MISLSNATGRLRGLQQRTRVGIGLLVFAYVSFAVRVILSNRIHGPWIFPDELGYEQVAANLARGRFGLYANSGLTYSPLYPVTLVPLFALGLSGSQVYEWIKVVNDLLMSLSVFPVYGIARFVLPRRFALVVVGLAAIAPLMYYTALGMSENLAYPLFLVAVWFLLRALAAPTRWSDALFLGSVVLAAAARIQLVVLLPAAVFALLLFGAVEARNRRRRISSVLRELAAQHVVLLAACGLIVLAGAVSAFTGGGTFSVAGRYSSVPGHGLGLGHIVKLFIYHTQGLVFVAGVFPFIGALAAAFIFVRSRPSAEVAAFAAAAVTLTLGLLAETAYSVNAFERDGDAPRIHERYLFYLVPFFLTALVASLRSRRVRKSPVVYVAATLVAMVAAYELPYQTVINGTVVADSFSFQIFASDQTLQSIPHAALYAVCIVAACGALLLMLRSQPVAVALVVALTFLFLSERAAVRISAAANGQHSFTVQVRRNWVDREHPGADVALVVGPAITDPVAQWQTEYHNLSIRRLYFTCLKTLAPDFGEQRVSIRPDGVVLAETRPLRTRYAVVPSGLGVEGRVLAHDRVAKEELIQTADGTLRVRPGARGRWACRATHALG